MILQIDSKTYDMVGLNESAAEWMSGLDYEEETDAVSGSIEATLDWAARCRPFAVRGHLGRLGGAAW